MKSILFIFAIMLALVSSVVVETTPQPLCLPSCSCQPFGINVALSEDWHMTPITSNRRFRKMTEGFYPHIYDESDEGEAVRQSCPFFCRNGRPSKTRLIDVFADADTFQFINRLFYKCPESLRVNLKSMPFLRSIRTILGLKAYRWCDTSEIWEKNDLISFVDTQFYYWVKDIRVLENYLLRECYLRRRSLRIMGTEESHVLDMNASEHVLENASTTIALEFPDIAILSATLNEGLFDTWAYKQDQVSRLFRLTVLAIETGVRSGKGNVLIPSMMNEFLHSMQRTVAAKFVSAKTPRMETYSDKHPAAVAFQTCISEELKRLFRTQNRRINLDTLEVPNITIDKILSEFEFIPSTDARSPKYGLLMSEAFCYLVRLAGIRAASCEEIFTSYAVDGTFALIMIPVMLQRLANYHDDSFFVSLVGIMHKVDLARLAYDAARKGYTPNSALEYRSRLNGDLSGFIELFQATQTAWIRAAFD